MTDKLSLVVSIDRDFGEEDEKAINRLMAQWLVYDVKIKSSRNKTEIKLFHTSGAKSDLLKEVAELFPGGSFEDK